MYIRPVPYILIVLIVLGLSPLVISQEDSQAASDYTLIAQIGRGNVAAMEFSADNQRLAVMTSRGVWIYQSRDLEAEAFLFAPSDLDTTDPSSMVINSSFTRLAGLNHLGQVVVWDVPSGAVIYEFPEFGFESARLTFDRTDTYLAALSPEIWRIWNMSDGSVHLADFSEVMFPPGLRISGIGFSADGTFLGISAYSIGSDSFGEYYRFVDTSTGALVDDFTISDVPFVSPLTSRLSDGDLMLIRNDQNEVRFVMLAVVVFEPGRDSYRRVAMIPYEGRARATFSPDNSLLAVANDMGTIRVWDIALAETHPPCPSPQQISLYSDELLDLDNCDWEWQALLSHATAHAPQQLDDPNETTTQIRLNQYQSLDMQWSISIFPDNQRFVEFVHQDGRQIRLNTPEDIHLGYIGDIHLSETRITITWSGESNPEFSGDGFIISWDINPELDTQEPTTVVSVHGTDAITSTAISPNRTQLLTSSWDNTIRLWDIESMSQLAILHDEMIFDDVAFAADGRTVLALGKDGVIYVWSAASDGE